MEVSKTRTAVAIFSFNRPQYLKRVLDSVEQNAGLEGMDFYMFQEGSVNKFSKRIAGDEKDIESCVDVWKTAKLPNKVLIRRTDNVGIGFHQFEAKCLLFEGLNYEEVIFLEDDLILSKNYFRLLKVMLDQFRDDKMIGAVTCNGQEASQIYTVEQKMEILYKLKIGRPQLWAWATWRDRWIKIKPSFLEYLQHIKNIDYYVRPHEEIRSFYKSKGLGLTASSQDTGMYYAFFKNNFLVLNTWINRGKYIGEMGEHMRPDRFKDSLQSQMILDEFVQDETVMKFDELDRDRSWAYYKSTFVLPPAA